MALAARVLSYTGVEFLFREEDSSDDEAINNNLDQSVVYGEFALAIQNALYVNISQVTGLQRDDDNVLFSERTNSTNHGDEIERSSEVEEATTGETTTEGKNRNNSDENMTEETNNGPLETDGTDSTETLHKEAENVPMPIVKAETLTQIEGEIAIHRKKRPSRQERYQKKERKRKQVDPSDFGFHMSSIPRLDVVPASDDGSEGSVETETETSNNDLDLAAQSIDESANVDPVSNSTHSEDIKDDETFFADLGIDIHDSGSYDMDFIDWDGLRFSATKKTTVAPKPQQASKSRPVQKKCTTTPSPAKSKQVEASESAPTESSTAEKKSKHKNVDQLEVLNVPNYKMSTREQILFLELECSSGHCYYIRKDRHRKVLKVHKAVKTQYCMIKNIVNNLGRKKMHMHHRLIKKTNVDIEFRFQSRPSSAPMPKVCVDLTVAKAIRIKQPAAISPIRKNRKSAPPQNLNHVLHETNTPSDISLDLVSFLMNIQNRDLTPEDYDMLLRLDDTVKAKTVSKNILEDLKTEVVGPDIANILMCVICMEPYLEGQSRKFLPCEHDFHSDCIDSWLANSSQNCPLDGLPIVNS